MRCLGDCGAERQRARGVDVSSRPTAVLGRFEDHVGVDAPFTRADQTDRTGHAGLEGEVGFPNHRGVTEGELELGAYYGVVVVVEFRGHPNGACFPACDDGFDHLRHGWDAVHQRQVHCLDPGPGREHGVGDDQAVGVPHPSQEGQQVGIENTTAEHGSQGTTAVGRSQGALPNRDRSPRGPSVPTLLLGRDRSPSGPCLRTWRFRRNRPTSEGAR